MNSKIEERLKLKMKDF